MAKVITTQDAAFTAFTQATQHAQSRAQAAEAERAATEAARLALPTQVQAITGPAVQAAQAAASLAVQRAGVVGSVANDAALAGRAAGDYRVGLEIVSWNGNAVTARTAVLASDADVQEARALAQEADSKADSASTQAQTTLAALTLTRAQLLSGAADPGNVSRVWDEHGSLRVRPRAGGETPDNGITFALAGNRIAEREWDGKNVYTAWYGLKPGDDVAGFRPAFAAVPVDGVLHWTPGKYVHGLAGYAGQPANYNPLWIVNRYRFTWRMAGVTVEAAPDLPNTTYYGGFLFLGCTQFRVEGWPVYDGRLDVRDAQKFHLRDLGTGELRYNPDGSPVMGYSDPNSANLLLDGWRVTVGCVGAYLEVEGHRALMDSIIVCGGSVPTDAILTGIPPVDVELHKCVGRGSLRQGLSVVGVDGLTLDGGLYELTGKTQGPDGQPRGALPMAGIDFEGESTLFNKRVRVKNSPEIRFNRGAGLMVHQYTREAQIDSALIHENDGYGLNIDNTAQNTKIGAGVILRMNGRNKGAGAESFEVNLYGTGTELNGSTIITDAHRAINNAGAAPGQKIMNVTVKVTGTNPGASAGWVYLGNPDIIVDGLTVDGAEGPGGYGAVHAAALTTGAIRNCRIRAQGKTGAGLAGSAVNAQGIEVSGYTLGNALVRAVPPPVMSYASGTPFAYTDLSTQRSQIVRSSSSDTVTFRLFASVAWELTGTAKTELFIAPPAGWSVVRASAVTIQSNATGEPLGTGYVKSFDQANRVILSAPASGLTVADVAFDVEMRRA
ncbi:hypothetical protein [Deinococcus sp. PEB2-63]